MKISVVKIVKIGSYVLSAASMVLGAWVGKKENDSTLEKLVNEKLKDK